MSGTGELKRLEQVLTYLRLFGVVLAVVSILTQDPPFPDEMVESWAWTLAMILAVGSLMIWGVLARVNDAHALYDLGRAGFALDMCVVMGFSWIFAFEDPYMTWAVLLILPLEGALRYRFRGAMLTGVAVAVFQVAQTMHYSSLHEVANPVNMWMFTSGLALLIGGVAGTMAENWYSKSLEFEKQSTKLAELDRLKDRYLAVTSHEIRGPLTAVIAGVQTMRRRADRLSPERRAEMFEMIETQAKQLARLVDDLMLSSELQAGSLALNPEWSDIEPVVQQAIEAAAGKRRGHRLELYVEPVRCEIDPSRVAQLIRNLVENAYKYTPEHTRVAVTARRTSSGILLEVADEGEGIPPDKRDQLFKAFSRVEETSAGQEGVGLGLFVVSQLVGAMGGHIDFSSSSRGTTFGIHIPCRVERLDQPRLEVVRGEGA